MPDCLFFQLSSNCWLLTIEPTSRVISCSKHPSNSFLVGKPQFGANIVGMFNSMGIPERRKQIGDKGNVYYKMILKMYDDWTELAKKNGIPITRLSLSDNPEVNKYNKLRTKEDYEKSE